MAIKGKPRERLISCALQLFNQQGFHATGIDAILAGSKDEQRQHCTGSLGQKKSWF